MHRLTKVEHVQEELLRILMQPTALMVAKDASAMASTGYDTSPTVVKSVLESLYKQVREGRGHHHAAAIVQEEAKRLKTEERRRQQQQQQQN